MGWLILHSSILSEFNGLSPLYFISASGSDSNAGTRIAPWAITALNSKGATYAGKTVGILDGTYDLISIMGQPDATSGSSQRARLSVKGGSSGSPTILVSQSPRGAIVDFNRAAQVSASLEASLQPDGDYVTFDGLTFTGNNYQCVMNNFHGGKGGSSLTVKNCYFTDQDYLLGGSQNSTPIYTEGFDDILIQNCRFDSCRASGDSDRHSMFEAYSPSKRITMEYCTVIGSTNGHKSGDMFFAKVNGVEDVTLRYNYYEAFDQHDVLMQHWGDNNTASVTTVHHNVFYRPGSSGDSIFLLRNGVGLIGTWNVYNNTFIAAVTLDTSGFEQIGVQTPVAFNFYNNVCSQAAGGSTWGYFDLPGISALGTFDYNAYNSSPAPKFYYNNRANNVTGLSSWQTASSKDAHSAAGTISLAGGANPAGYALAGGSIGKNAGSDGADMGARPDVILIGANF